MFHLRNLKHTRLFISCFCPFSLFQRSPCVSPLVAPTGSHPTQQSGRSTGLAASHVPKRGPDSESPGGRLPPSGAGRLFTPWFEFFGGKSAGHAGTSDLSPDQDACVCGSQGDFTGNKQQCSICHLHIMTCTLY